MAIINISVNKTTNPLDANNEGWNASISRLQTDSETGTGILQGESLIYNTKIQAWETIRTRAERLDYANDKVHVNRTPVNSFQDAEQAVNAIPE